MSEITKLGFELSFSDLRKLFEASEPDQTEYYGGKISSKIEFDYQKLDLVNKSSNKIKEQLINEIQIDTSSSYEDLSLHSIYSEKSSNYSESKDQERSELKVLFENAIYKFDDDDKSADHSLLMQKSETNIKNDFKIPSSGVTRGSFLSGFGGPLSIKSSHQKDLYDFLAKEHSIYEIADLDDCLSVWSHEVQSHKMVLSKHLNHDLGEHINLSRCVCFGRIHFRCHKFMLRSSRFFRRCAEKVYKFEPEQQLTPLAFSIFYIQAMGIRPKVPSRSLLDVRNAAKILDVPELEQYCMKLLDSNLYHENEAFEVFKAAKAQKSLLIQRLMVQRIFRYFLPLIASKDFIEMNVDDVCDLLESDTIGVNSEIEVFFAAILWLNSKWKNRNENVVKRVMNCVRYSLIPPWFTYTLKKSTGILEVDRVIENKSVSKMIENGASIAATISLYFLDKMKFEPILIRLQPKVPKQRIWIYDRNCTYHYGAHEKVSEAVDYLVFLDYLRMLQMEGKNYWCNFQEGTEGHFVKIFCQKFLDTAWSKVRL